MAYNASNYLITTVPEFYSKNRLKLRYKCPFNSLTLYKKILKSHNCKYKQIQTDSFYQEYTNYSIFNYNKMVSLFQKRRYLTILLDYKWYRLEIRIDRDYSEFEIVFDKTTPKKVLNSFVNHIFN